MALNVFLNKIFIVHKKSQIQFDANSTCNLATTAIVKLLKFFFLSGFKLFKLFKVV